MAMTSILIPTQTLDISSLQQVAEGGERVVFTSTAYPAVVFKLQKRPQQDRMKRRDLKGLLLRYWAGFHNYSVVQENKAFVKASLAGVAARQALPYAKLFGFVSSDQGPLQICEKITLDGISLGPSVKALRKSGPISAEDIAALTRFAQSLLRSNIPTHDVNTTNVVKGLGADGLIRFVLIDGVGDIDAIPIRTYVPKARRARLAKGLARFTKVGLEFDLQAFAFKQA